MKILVASYPRSGSNTVMRMFGKLAGPNAVLLHSPFNKYPGNQNRDFWREVDATVAESDVVKHHPGNLLSVKQNRHLYRRWVDGGGAIVHLHRRDRTAQARSLAIARSLGSWHRPHRIDTVDQALVDGERDDLQAELDQQSATVAEFPHTSVAYEDLFGGPVEGRLNALRSLLAELDPPALSRMAEVEDEVRVLLGPSRQVRADPATGGARLVPQVPTFTGVSDLLGPDACRRWVERFDAEVAAGRSQRAVTTAALDGAHQVLAADLAGRTQVKSLLDDIATGLADQAQIKTTIAGDAEPVVVGYDGDLCPDHDLTLAHPIPATAETAVEFTISLSPDGTFAGGGVHLAGRGVDERSTCQGSLFYFASGIGARREAVSSGTLRCLVGRLPVIPGQIPCAGDFFGLDSGHWRDGHEDGAGL